MESLLERVEIVIFLSLLGIYTIMLVCVMIHLLSIFIYLGWAQLMDTEMKGWTSVGVVAAIIPWNFPLMLLSWNVTHVYHIACNYEFNFKFFTIVIFHNNSHA